MLTHGWKVLVLFEPDNDLLWPVEGAERGVEELLLNSGIRICDNTHY